MNPDSDAQLVESALNGDVASFGGLYRRYYNGMVALAYAVLGDLHLAEDAAQESFAIACRELPKLKSPEKFASWLAGICRNRARQTARQKSRQVTIANDPSDSADENSNKQQLIEIRQTVWTLKPAYRELIVMRYYDNMSYEQMAAVLNLSVQAVNGRLIRAKRKLAKQLKQYHLTGGKNETF